MRFRKATENNSLIPGILAALAYSPNVFAFRVEAEGRKGQRRLVPKGTADILGVLNSAPRPWLPMGRAFAIETKASHRPACKCASCEAQRVWRTRWEACGGLYILARSPQDAIDGLLGKKAA